MRRRPGRWRGRPGPARREGVEVYADQYPYLASATSLGAALVPRYPWTTAARVQIEPGFPVESLAELRRRGYTLEPRSPLDMYFGGVHAILVRPDGLMVGAADPRRDGAARGF